MQENNAMLMTNDTTSILDQNKKKSDNSSRLVFQDPILCAQFIRDYVKIPALQSVRPEDIEDVTERFLPLFTSEREADIVKRIHLGNEKAIFLISLIEHKTKVDYNVIVKLLRYMCYIWEEYEKEMQRESDRKRKEQEESQREEKQGEENQGEERQREKGKREKGSVSSHKDFKYPPILPIVYFEGSGKWTAVRSLKERIYLSDIFEPYIPDFTYELVRLHDYSNDQLLEHNDEMSLIMLLNKLQSIADLQGISEVQEYTKDFLKDTPQHLIDIIGMVTTALLNRMSLPQDEIDGFLDLIKERKMPELFECFEKVDVPKMREEIQQEREEIQQEREEIRLEKEQMQSEKEQMQSEKEQMQSEKAQMQSEKHALQTEREELTAQKDELTAQKEELKAKEAELQISAETLRDKISVENICKMYLEGCPADLIAKFLQEDTEKVQRICQIAEGCGADCDVQTVWMKWRA